MNGFVNISPEELLRVSVICLEQHQNYNGEDVPLKFFVHPYFWKRFNNDSPKYGLNFISDDMRNRIIDNFDSCVYGTVFID